ncbi:MAG: hypothetical protein ACI9VI_002596 [Candidatus Azotimanducaceae bacterium]|jgi:hypothetical protein
MTNKRRKPPVLAYLGEDDYLFASYAHADSEWVYPEIEWLTNSGIRIWYDEGIKGGSSWTEELANLLDQSAGVLFFVSENATSSKNVTNEIYFALEVNKPVLIITHEVPVLPAGLRLGLG